MLILIIIFILITLIVSCNKFEIVEEFHPDKGRFLTLPPNSPPILNKIVEDLKMQDSRNPFINNFILKNGYPLWKFAKITVKEGNYSSVIYQSDTLISIPIVEDGKTYVKSILAIKVNSDVWYKLLESVKYKNYLPDSSGNTTFSVKQLFTMFMDMEYKIFGHNEFIITDEEVLNNMSYVLEGVYLPDYGTQLTFANGCTIINWGYYVGGSFHITQSEQLCLNNNAELTYTLEAPLDEGGGGYDDAECKRGFIDVKDFDENNEPIIPCAITADTLKYPCDIAFAEANKLSEIYTGLNIDSIISTIPGFEELEVEKGFGVFQKFSVNPNDRFDTTYGGYRASTIFTGTDSGIQMQYAIPYLSIEKAATHTHHKNSYPAPSAEDIYQLIKKRKENKDFAGSFIIAFNGEKYALSITDWEKARNFINTEGAFLDGTKWMEDSEIGKAFEKAYKYFENGNPSKKNFAYEMTMAAVLNQYSAGVTLNKKDALGNFKPIVIKTYPDLRKPKKTIYTQVCL